MAPPTPVLELEDLHTYYGKSHVLQGVSLRLMKGEIVALLGRNGAGKTTTLQTVMGLVRPRQGRVLLHGEPVHHLPAYQIARRGLGYVPQGRGLFTRLTVLENLRAAERDRGQSHLWDLVFSLFPVLKERLDQRAGTLSGGEQQMLAIARALLASPSVLLLDEPSTGLMPLVVSALAEALRRLNAAGLDILLVEERIPLALELAHRVYVMEAGRIVFEGRREEVTEEVLHARYFGAAPA